MKVTPLDYTLDYTSYRESRSAGLHLTDCLDLIEQSLKSQRPRARLGPFSPADDEVEYEGWEDAAPLGFAWEDLMVRSLEAQGHAIYRGEIVSDGLVMTPDAVDLCCFRLWECKLKWAALSKNPPEANWRWLMQVKSYLRALGLTEAVIAAMYVRGNGQPPTPIRAFRHLSFTPTELEENWRSVLSARDKLLAGTG